MIWRYSSFNPFAYLAMGVSLCLAEALLIMLLPFSLPISVTGKSLLDAVMLSALVFPVFYFLCRALVLKIAGRKRTEKKLFDVMYRVSRGKKEWEYTADSLPELICLLDENGRAIRANKTAETWNIARVHDIKGKEFHELLHGGCRESSCSFYVLWKQAWQEAFTGKPAEFECYDEILGRDILIFVRPFQKNIRDEGMNFTVVVVQDITTKKKMEKNLMQRQKALQAIYEMAIALDNSIETVCSHVVMHIAELINAPYVSINRIGGERVEAVSKISGGRLFREEYLLTGSPCETVYKTEDIHQVRGRMKELFPEKNFFIPAGAQSYIGIPVKDNSHGLVGVIDVMDVKERIFSQDEIRLIETFARYAAYRIEWDAVEKRLRNSQKMELLGRLTAGVAHEVRNPLNAILAVTEALKMDIGDDPEYGPFLDHICAQVTRLTHLMREMLDLGKPTRPANLRRASIVDICAAGVNMWNRSIPAPKHRARLISPPSCSNLYLTADIEKLQQVFYNLLENAAQHSPEDCEILVCVLEPQGKYIKTRVIDRGAGIPPENLDKVFDPFFTTRRKGTGLGLCIVKRIIEDHEGFVAIWNDKLLHGCTVEVSLPLPTERIHEAEDSNNRR